MHERLLVLLSGAVIGVLERDSGADPEFTYLQEYVADGDVALSATLPLQASTHPPARVRTYLAGLLPENSSTRRAWATQLGVDGDDAFGILAEMGWDCPGAVQFCREESLDELHERSYELESASDAEIGERIRRSAAGEPSWTMEDEHWSLGGQQQKFALARRDGEWHTALGSAPTTHIVKPGIAALHHQALLEHVTMAAADALGVDVAPTAFSRFEDQWAIVVERFDRADFGERVVRIHQEDFAQACGRMPHQKYEANDGPGLRDIMRVTGRSSTDLHNDKLAILDFLAFNLVAGAPDGHAKNIALLRPQGAVHVAPLFDLASGLAYATGQVERSVAVSIGGERVVSRIHLRQWERAAKQLGLPLDLVVDRVRTLATTAPAVFDTVLAELPTEAPGRQEVAERLLPAIASHCTAVLQGL